MNLFCCMLTCLVGTPGANQPEYVPTEVFTLHPNGAVVSLYDDASLTTKRMDIYPDINESDVGCMLVIDSETNQSLRVAIDPLGYLFASKGSLAVNTRNYDDNVFCLYNHPSEDSEIIMRSEKQQTVIVYGICHGWLYVRAETENGRLVDGWLPPNMQCGNPYTTCN